MSKYRLWLVSALVLLLSTATLYAASPAESPAEEANLDILLSAIRANRKALIAINLQLTDDEAGKFWPVYEQYQKDRNEVGDRLVALIDEYTASFKDLADDKAMRIVQDSFTIEADRVKVKQKYVDQFAKALSGRKLARFYQLENKMDAVLRYELASTIPVIDEESGGGSE